MVAFAPVLLGLAGETDVMADRQQPRVYAAAAAAGRRRETTFEIPSAPITTP